MQSWVIRCVLSLGAVETPWCGTPLLLVSLDRVPFSLPRLISCCRHNKIFIGPSPLKPLNPQCALYPPRNYTPPQPFLSKLITTDILRIRARVTFSQKFSLNSLYSPSHLQNAGEVSLLHVPVEYLGKSCPESKLTPSFSPFPLILLFLVRLGQRCFVFLLCVPSAQVWHIGEV